jgi:predicted GH43/DUF377 family glycosyl hydrolase
MDSMSFVRKAFYVLWLFTMMAIISETNIGMAQIQWEKHIDGPIVNPGAKGEWDSAHIFDPVVILYDAEYEMWYSGDDGENSRIGYATSMDGIIWEKHPDSPVIDLGAEGLWDSVYASNCSVIFADGQYRMWYCGVGDHDPSNVRIGYATSADGVVWEKHRDNPVLDIGIEGTWESHSVSDPTVVFDGTEYRMWYSGSDGSITKIGYATSAHGVAWEKHPNNPVIDVGPADTWSQNTVSKPAVVFRNGEYMMWYTGYDRGPRGKRYRIGYATSPDGIFWTEYPDNPVLEIGLPDEWDSARVSGASVLFDDTGYRMWYHGFDGARWRIGYAEDANGNSRFGVTPRGKLSTTWASIRK